MIENERQYRISKAWLEKFAQSAQAIPQSGAVTDPLIRAAMADQYASQAKELQEQLAEYEALRRGQVTTLEVESLTGLPDALIRARIASGLTQKALAHRLGLREQQIQRYEATRYRGVTLARVQAVMDALGVRIHERLTLSASEHAS